MWNVSCPKHPEKEAILEAARRGPVVVYEDHNAETGLGSVVAGILATETVATPFRILGVPRYGVSGDPDAVFKDAGIAPEAVADAVRSLCRKG